MNIATRILNFSTRAFKTSPFRNNYQTFQLNSSFRKFSHFTAAPGMESLKRTTRFRNEKSQEKVTNAGDASSECGVKAKKAKIDYRLPEDVVPLHYDLYLHPRLEKGNFDGKVVIEVNIKNPRKDIVLHGKQLDVKSCKVLNPSGKPVSLASDQPGKDKVRDFLTIEFPNNVEKGVYTVEIEYSGSLTAGITGFYRSQYTNAKGDKRFIATSKFEPTFARLAFPCFDEPAMKAKFTVHLVRPSNENYIALSNMNEESAEPDKPEAGLTTVHFAKSVEMSTYLACFIVCDFDHVEDQIENSNGKNFNFRSYATPGQSDKVKFATDTGKKVTEYYIRYFGVDYPLPKLDMIAIPDFVSGAMEHWGLVTFRETSLLFDDAISSTANKQRVATVVAHEISHMWFGNLVTMDWWNELWLNEGFASYMQEKGIDKVYNDWGLLEQFLPGTVHGVMKLDGTLGSHPIVQTVKTPEQITEIFDSITYSKGASIIRMLENFVGEDRFAQGVSNYLQKHKYGNARTTDLLAELQKIVGNEMDLTKIMDTWTRQMGLPVVQVRKGKNDGEYILTQKRFLADPDKANQGESSPFGYRWEIPLTYITDTKTDYEMEWFKTEENEKTIKVDKNEKWIKFNNDQIGYYRVNYEKKMWQALSEQLNDDHKKLTASDRAHLLNDVFSLAEATELPYDTALTMTTYLDKEKHYVPWAVAAQNLYTLRKLLRETDIHDKFTEYARGVVSPVYEDIDWNVKPGDKHLDKHFRVEVLSLACAMGEEGCLDKVGDIFKKWINDPDTSIHPDLRTLVYTYGMQSAGTKENWNTVWKRFLSEPDPSEKAKLMQGLSYIKDSDILENYLKLAWDENNVRGQDYFTCVGQISANNLGTEMVWDYVREHWPKLVERFGIGERNLGRFIPTITGRFTTEARLQEMKDFFEKYPEAGAGAAARKQALETIENNIKWLKVNKKSVGDWLEENVRKN